MGWVTSGAVRPTASTRVTPGSSRHACSAPRPTIPVAPNRITCIAHSPCFNGAHIARTATVIDRVKPSLELPCFSPRAVA